MKDNITLLNEAGYCHYRALKAVALVDDCNAHRALTELAYAVEKMNRVLHNLATIDMQKKQCEKSKEDGVSE